MVTAMSEHPNAIRVRELFDAFRRADPRDPRRDPRDASGTSPAAPESSAGEHRGRDAILAFLGNVQSR